MGRNIITFELRDVKDDDITKALEATVIAGKTQSEVIRAALRAYFNPKPTSSSPRTRPPVDAPLIHIELQAAEKDDAQLDDALNDLLNF